MSNESKYKYTIESTVLNNSMRLSSVHGEKTGKDIEIPENIHFKVKSIMPSRRVYSQTETYIIRVEMVFAYVSEQRHKKH